MHSLTLLAMIMSLTGAMQSGQEEADTISARYQVFSEYLAPEKLYLHVDRRVYCPGETIWVCGYLRNASTLTVNPESNFIYVELLRPDGTAEERMKLKRDGAAFPGQFFLQEDIPSGTYTLRAYTFSQLGRAPEFMFHQSIEIVGSDRVAVKDGAGGRETIDLSFYPEGGRYFAGIPARVAFKVTDRDGRSAEADGNVVDGNGGLVARAATRHDGMGDFSFIPTPGAGYSYVLPSGETFPIPPASSEGASVSVRELSGRYLLRVSGRLPGRLRLLLRDVSEMRLVTTLEGIEGQKSLLIPSDAVNSGINHLLLINDAGAVVSERLFFRYDSGSPSVLVSLTEGSECPGSPRNPVSLDINLQAADGSPLDGRCSISVLRGSLSPYVQDDGITSYLSLSSELRGAINDPCHYFDASVPLRERSQDLDLLMMVQGWSYYDMASLLDTSSPVDVRLGGHRREYFQFIKGKVSRLLSSRAPTGFTLAVLIPSRNISSIIPVEEGKSFILDSLDLEEGTGMLIKVSRDGRGADYIPEWDGDEFAGEYRYFPAPGHAHAASKDIDISYEDPTDTLEAAVVVGESGDGILGINGVSMPKRDFKTYSYMNLVDYVRMREPAFYYENGLMSSHRTSLMSRNTDGSWDESPVKLLVDGMPAAWEAFETLSISEVESISISKQPDMIYRALDGVVAVKLLYGARVTSLSETEPSLLYFTPLGYRAPQQFYSPRYDRGEVSNLPDHRNTIFWSPDVTIRSGKALVEFCTSDDDDYLYSIQIEGMTGDGRPFSVRRSL